MKQMRNRPAISMGLAAMLLTLGAACGREADTAPPVATPTVVVNHTRAALGSPIEVTYQFDVAPGATFDQNYRVFVHFVDADGELMWTDDHDPLPPTTEWKPGQTIRYSRTSFIPIYPYVGETAVEVGLYSVRSQTRLPLAGTQRGQRAYKVAAMTLLPQTENVFLFFKDGWHLAEVAPENVAVEWQWTKKNATISFRNPRRDALFYLHLDGQPRLLREPQAVTVQIGAEVLQTFVHDAKGEIIRRIPIAASQLGSGDTVELTISVDRTFVPGQMEGGVPTDMRELGVRVFHAFVEPR